MAKVDAAVQSDGPPAGCMTMLNALGIQVSPQGVGNIPLTGPAIILANHPGAYDSMAIGSLIPRTDLKVIVARNRLYQVLPHIHPKMIYVSEDRSESMMALRQTVQHLNQGGILLQFGSGLIEPDPAIHPVGDEVFEQWSPSIELFLRKVPETQVVPTIASGVLLERFERHPLTLLRKTDIDKRRLAEFMQVIQQLLSPRSVSVKPCVSFGPPFTLQEIETENHQRRIMPGVLAKIKSQLDYHMQIINQNDAP